MVCAAQAVGLQAGSATGGLPFSQLHCRVVAQRALLGGLRHGELCPGKTAVYALAARRRRVLITAWQRRGDAVSHIRSPGQDGGPRRGAHRRCRVETVEQCRVLVLRESVQVGRARAHGGGVFAVVFVVSPALIVREHDQNIGWRSGLRHGRWWNGRSGGRREQ